MALDVSLLKTIPLFAEVPDDKLQKIAPFANADQFAEGEVVIKEGGYSNHFYAIEEGTGVPPRTLNEMLGLVEDHLLSNDVDGQRRGRRPAVAASGQLQRRLAVARHELGDVDPIVIHPHRRLKLAERIRQPRMLQASVADLGRGIKPPWLGLARNVR